jgi:hypothetical protein
MAALTSTSRMRCMYIFNRNGVCLHYHVWLRPHTTLSQQQDQKLMFGLLFSLKSFTAKMDPLGLAPIPSHPIPSAFLQTRRLSFCITGRITMCCELNLRLVGWWLYIEIWSFVRDAMMMARVLDGFYNRSHSFLALWILLILNHWRIAMCNRSSRSSRKLKSQRCRVMIVHRNHVHCMILYDG